MSRPALRPHLFTLSMIVGLFALACVRPCAAGGAACRAAPGVTAIHLPVEAYAPSVLALRIREPKGDGHPAAGEGVWSVGPRGGDDPPTRFERYAGTGALIGGVTGVTVMVIRTRGEDGISDFFEPLVWLYGGAVGAAAGWVVGGAIALATGD